MIKQNFHGRGEDDTYSEAVKRRPTIMRQSQDKLIQLEAPGINIYKKVEMCDKYKRLIPTDCKDDVLYSDVSIEEREAVKKEKEMRKITRVEIKDIKSKAVQTVNVKRKLELDLEKEQSPTKNVDIRKK
jgi:hypothetical protein